MTSAKDMTIDEFCDLHNACSPGREWALANCSSMQDAWDKLPDEYLLWVAFRPGVLTDKELRLGAVFAAKSVEHLLTDERSRFAIVVAEKFAFGKSSKEDLAAAYAAAYAAADAAYAAYAAAYAAADAAYAAADAAADAAAYAVYTDYAANAATFAVYTAANAAANAADYAANAAADAADYAVYTAANAAADAAAFARWYRSNTKPCFTKENVAQ